MDNQKHWIIIESVFGGVIVFIIFLYTIRKLFEGKPYKSDIRVDGKVIIVTGCNSGIGKETALDLAKRGGKIYMACLDYDECEMARQEIISRSGNQNIYNRQLDLASFKSIRAFAAKFLEEENHLDILINNAGLMTPTRFITEDGLEMAFGVNYVGHFLLTNLLLDSLQKSQQGRIISVSSFGYKYGKINKCDINSEKHFHSFIAYAQSKLAVVLFARHLGRLLKESGSKVTINAIHPGICKTQIFHNTIIPEYLLWIFTPVSWIVFNKPISAAHTSISLAVDPKWTKTNGQYLQDCEIAKISKNGLDEKTAKWLWDYTERITKLK